jgi:predicted DNA-binding protein (MmcQ/YjbR family)
MARDISKVVREVCLSFPESEEVLSHGSPNFRVRGKTFATYVINHHGDGRVALWLNSPPGAQQLYTQAEPDHYFVPPYVGPRGWLGVQLDKESGRGGWKQIAKLVREAYEKVAPPALSAEIGKTIAVEPPTSKLSAVDVDPLQSRRAQAVLKAVRKICGGLPEVTEASQFGSPVWRAGKKSFACCYVDKQPDKPRLLLSFWVGVDRQGLLTRAERFSVPAYMGHNGWIALDVTDECDWDEVYELARNSYRHFALKRMLAQLPGGA